jgi:aminoglycoside 6'-N-acetyltransferase
MAEQIELEPLDVRHVKPLRAIHEQPGVMRGWGTMDPLFPFDEPESTRYAIVVDGEVAGLVQHGEEPYRDNRHAYIDIFLGDDHAGRGIGTEVMRRVSRVLIEEHGHHRVIVDPYADNQAAIRCYEKVGFRPVGVRERFWRDKSGVWRDELLMELVTEPSTD